MCIEVHAHLELGVDSVHLTCLIFYLEKVFPRKAGKVKNIYFHLSLDSSGFHL